MIPSNVWCVIKSDWWLPEVRLSVFTYLEFGALNREVKIGT